MRKRNKGRKNVTKIWFRAWDQTQVLKALPLRTKGYILVYTSAKDKKGVSFVQMDVTPILHLWI